MKSKIDLVMEYKFDPPIVLRPGDSLEMTVTYEATIEDRPITTEVVTFQGTFRDPALRRKT